MKWEYKIVRIDANRWTDTGLPNELNQDFDQWGAQGWELVGTESLIRQGFSWFFFSGSYTDGIIAFFRRPVEH